MSCATDFFTVDDAIVPIIIDLKKCDGQPYTLEGGETFEFAFTGPGGEEFSRNADLISPARVQYLTQVGEFATAGTWSVKVWVRGPGPKVRRSLCGSSFSVKP
jgi:hypothetical protein